MNRNANGALTRNGATKEKALRSKRFYWSVGAIIVAAILFTLYYSKYVSSQQSYYNDRAFRLLSSMADKFSQRVQIAENVLKASASYRSSSEASRYIHRVLHGEIQEHDFTITNWHKADATAQPTREGSLTWFMPERPDNFRIRVDYRESPRSPSAEHGDEEVSMAPDTPCTGKLPSMAVCASVDFDPLVRPSFRDLEEGFFDDVLIADEEGAVLYQESRQGIRIQNIGAALLSSSSAASNNFFSKAAPQPSSSSAAAASQAFATLSQSSGRTSIELAGDDYELFVEPLKITLMQQQQHRRLVLCGLRTSKHSHAQTLVVPYTYLMWSVLILGAVFALGWPLLKFTFMSAKERLQTRHILYLLASILLATALVTLIALNFVYMRISDKDSRVELEQLAKQINANFSAELGSAISMLDTLAAEPALLKLAAGGEGNRANFLWDYKYMFQEHRLSYPYFRYFFVAGNNGWQRLKFTVNSETTPWTNVREEPFFHPVVDDELSKFNLGSTSRELRLDPLFSPNTGEFLVVLAAPWSLDKTKPGVKVLATRFESLFNPVLPTGYGYAVVDPDGKVLFHSSSVRNMNEDFPKEAQGDPALLAKLDQGTTGYLDVRYLGTDKELWVTPLEATSNPRLTLVVFKDSAYFTTVNMAVVVVFAVLIALYAILPAFLLVLVHILRRKEYPLDLIWPTRKGTRYYLRIGITNFVLSTAFFCRYGFYGPERTLIAVLAVVLACVLYALLERRGRWAVLGNSVVLVVLIALSGFSWVLVFAAAFAIYAFYPDGHDRGHETGSRFAALDSLSLKQPALKYAYTFVAVSLLVVLVVVPGVGFFKIAHDYVYRLFVQSQQLNLATRLAARDEAINDYYSHLKADPAFKTGRLEELWDRYDRVFLNCTADELDLSRARELQSTFLERGVLDLTARFPLNPLAARLQGLGRTEVDIPDVKWKAADQTTLKCGSTTFTGPSLMLIRPAEAKPIVSPYPIWPAHLLGPWLGVAVLGLALWTHFVASRLFLLDMERLPPLEKWQPKGGESSHVYRYILLLGHPKSGKQLAVRKLAHVQFIDFAEMATMGKWDLPAPSSDLVAIKHFEFGIDNADINMNKLHILEELMHVQQKRIILLSTVDPLYYLTAGSPDIVVSGEKKDIATATQLLDRWAAVLSPFRKVMIEDITVARFCKIVNDMRRRRSEPDFKTFIDRVVEECNHTAQLRKIGAAILYANRKQSGLSRERLVRELLDRADSYYRVLWSTCTQDERLALYQLAKDGWANPKNELAIQHLHRRKLVVLPASGDDDEPPCGNEPGGCEFQVTKRLKGLRIMNESFRQFIRYSQQREEIAAWEQEGEQSLWRFLKLSLGILGVAIAAWLLYSQQQFFNVVVAYVGAIGAAVGVVFKLLSDLRGRRSTANAGTQ